VNGKQKVLKHRSVLRNKKPKVKFNYFAKPYRPLP